MNEIKFSGVANFRYGNARYTFLINNKISFSVGVYRDEDIKPIYHIHYDTKDCFPFTHISFTSVNSDGVDNPAKEDIIIQGNIMNTTVDTVKKCIKEYQYACEIVEEILAFLKGGFSEYL